MTQRNLSAAEIRAAKKWLERRKISATEISPRKFAKAATILDMGFKETLEAIAEEQNADIGVSQED